MMYSVRMTENDGRPKKALRGKYPNFLTRLELLRPLVVRFKIDLASYFTDDTHSLRFDDFSLEFEFSENLKQELRCPKCL